MYVHQSDGNVELRGDLIRCEDSNFGVGKQQAVFRQQFAPVGQQEERSRRR